MICNQQLVRVLQLQLKSLFVETDKRQGSRVWFIFPWAHNKKKHDLWDLKREILSQHHYPRLIYIPSTAHKNREPGK